ncbi:MAG: hypothetical protein WCR86_10790 [Parabacteroides sp.]
MPKEHIDTTGGYVTIDGTEIDGISPGSLPFPKPSRDTKDVTTTKDTTRKKGLKILDPGSASFSGIAIPGDAGQIAIETASEDMQEHTIQVIVPEAGLVYEYQAYVSCEYPTEEDENTLTFNVDLECTGGFVRSTTYAGITSIEGAGVGITYFPSAANSALSSSANDVIFHEATGITTDTIEVTASSASYIGISYNSGTSWTELTSGTPTTFSSTYWPTAGNIAKAKIMVQESNKATRFINLIVARSS